MININRQQAIAMNYGYNIETLTVLIPGFATAIQRIQIDHILRVIENTYIHAPNPVLAALNSREYAQITDIYKWHAIGSLIQSIALALLIIPCKQIVLAPLFLMAGKHLISSISGYFEGGMRISISGNPPTLKVSR